MNRKKPPNDKTTPQIKDPIIAAIKTGLLLDGGDEDEDVVVDNVEEEDVVVCGGKEVDDIILGIEGSKLVVHLYSSLLLISSNKRSSSIFGS